METYVALKLVSGELILAQLEYETETEYGLEYPMITELEYDPQTYYPMLSLVPYNPLGTFSSYIILKKHVMNEFPVAQEVFDYYVRVMKRKTNKAEADREIKEKYLKILTELANPSGNTSIQ